MKGWLRSFAQKQGNEGRTRGSGAKVPAAQLRQSELAAERVYCPAGQSTQASTSLVPPSLAAYVPAGQSWQSVVLNWKRPPSHGMQATAPAYGA